MERQQSSDDSESLSLIQLDANYQKIAAELIEAGGELTPESEAALDKAVTALCEKTDAYGVVSDRLDNQAAYWKMQKDMCAKAQKTCENAIERLRERMRFILKDHPDKSLQGKIYRYFLAKSADKIEVDDNLLPGRFKTTQVSVTPNLALIKEELKKGVTIPGVTVTPSTALRTGRPK